MKTFLRLGVYLAKSLKFSFLVTAFLLLLLVSNFTSYSQVTQTFTTSGSYTVPNAAGLTSITVRAWGGGGGGASGVGNNKIKAGGGGGAFSSGTVAVIPGNSYPYTVGTGGTQSNGGGSSTFNSTSVVALGGGGANANIAGLGGSAADGIGTTKFSGGSGANTIVVPNYGGAGGGGSASLFVDGGSGSPNVAGTGGNGGMGTGNGGAGGNYLINGNLGAVPGGGGGGAGEGASNSGFGARGQIEIIYTCPVYSLTATTISSEVCAGTASVVTLSSLASGLPVGSYVVSYSLGAPNIGTYTSVMSVSTAGTGTFTTVALMASGTSSITITNLSSATCGNTIIAANKASIVVRPTPTSGIAGTTSVCQNATNPLITFTNPQSLPVTITYRINSGAIQTIGVAANGTSTASASTATAGTFIYTLVNVAYQTAPNCTNAQTGTATITVNSTPSVTNQIQTICSGGSFNITPLHGAGGNNVPTGTLYRWTAPVVTGGLTGGSAQSTGQPSIGQTLVNPTNTTQTATYTVTPVAGLCAGTPFSVIITVSPKPSVTMQTITVCSAAPFTHTPADGSGNIVPAGTTYSWSSPILPAGLTGATAGSNANNMSGTLTNATNTALTASYVITPTSGSCVGSSFTLNIIVDPKPFISTQAANICSETPFTITPANIVGGNNVPISTTYTWTNPVLSGGLSGGSAQATPQSSISETLISASGTTKTATYTVTPISATCVGAPFTLTITVYPGSKGGLLMPATSVACAGTNSGIITLSGHRGTIKRWQISTNAGVSWTDFANTNDSFTYSNLPITSLFRAAVQNGTGICAEVFSASSIVNVLPLVTPQNVTVAPANLCSGQNATLQGLVAGYTMPALPGGDFNTAGSALDGPGQWRAKENSAVYNMASNADNQATTRFNLTNGAKTFAGTFYDNIPPGDGKFMIVAGAVNCTLETPIFSLQSGTSASIDWYHAYVLSAGSSISIDISLDGGNTYLTPLLVSRIGAASEGNPNQGFTSKTINLNNYLGRTNLRVRFSYTGNSTSSWGLEGVGLNVINVPELLNWALINPAPAGATLSSHYLSAFDNTSVLASPNTPGIYTYQIGTSLGGCQTTTQTVQITVNPVPLVSAVSQPVCQSQTTQPLSLNYANSTNDATTYSISWNLTPSNTFASANDLTIPSSGAAITVMVPPNTAANTYTGSLTIKNSFACASAASPISVVVKPSPTVTAADVTTCYSAAAQTIALPVSPGTGSIAYSIGWISTGFASSNGAVSSTAPVTIPAGTPVGTHSGYITVTNSDGCTSRNDTFNIIIKAALTAAAVPTTAAVCLHNPASISTTVSSGLPVANRWQRRVNSSADWADIFDGTVYTGTTTSTLTVVNPTIDMVDHEFRNMYSTSAPCNEVVYTPVEKLKIMHVWLGTVSTDWQTGANWSDGAVPTRRCDTVHIISRTNQPTLNSGTSSIINLLIYSGANFTLANHLSSNIKISRSIVKSPLGSFNALNGRIILNGGEFATEPAQVLKGSYFVNNIVKYLTISNPLGASVVPNGGDWTDTLNISYHLNFENVSNATFAGNNNLTLMSRAGTDNTASVGILNSPLNNSVTGDVIVERYLPARKSWRFISTPVQTGKTIRQTWQESGNNIAGFGTQITGPDYNGGGNGLDVHSQRPSMKHFVYDALDVGYLGITNTNTALTNAKGYMIFVRGDRSSTIASGTTTPTILRARGNLITGTQNYSVRANGDTSIGNPYASRIDLRTLFNGVTSVTATVCVWDPFQGGSFGVGAFKQYTRDGSGNFVQVPGGGVNNYIESGQAFFIQSSTNGSLSVREEMKSLNSLNLSRGSGSSAASFHANLYGAGVDGPSSLIDGALINNGAVYSNGLDNMDVRKMFNAGTNLSILNSGKDLNVERRNPFAEADTIHYKITGMTPQVYKLEFVPENLDQPNLIGYLEDAYTKSRTEISLSNPTIINFTVNNTPASFAVNRFRLVFKSTAVPSPPAPPFNFTEVKGVRNAERNVEVFWKAINEINIQEYTVERSVDGVNFTGIITTAGTNSTVYAKTDLSSLATVNFYRIKATTYVGEEFLSQVVKVQSPAAVPAITSFGVYPNPVQNGKMQVKFTNKPRGNYQILLTNKLGQVLYHQTTTTDSENELKVFDLGRDIKAGIYQLIITHGEDLRYTQQVFIH